MSAGIDYSLGTANFDPKTGIHFGVISQNSVLQAWADSSEPVYPPAHCPECDAELKDGEGVCPNCNAELEDEVYEMNDGVEPIGSTYQGDGYILEDCLDSDIMVLESPFYTFAKFCSPCVPGAGDLDAPDEDGVKTFCLSHDWFEDSVAPYPVYKVADDSLVEAEK